MLFLKTNRTQGNSRVKTWLEANEVIEQLLKSYNHSIPLFPNKHDRIEHLLNKDFVQRILTQTYTGYKFENGTDKEFIIVKSLPDKMEYFSQKQKSKD